MTWFRGLFSRPAMVVKASPLRPMVQAVAPTLVRGKRTARLEPGARRVINMLSVFSARKKQPRRLKLCKEDLMRHFVVQSAWKLHSRDKKLAQEARLKGQYEKIQEACEELEKLDEGLFKSATERQKGKRFSLELRVPTDTPPRQPWQFQWKRPEA